MRGGDVRQLNHDLAALGYANSGYISALGWDYFSWETSYGLERLQGAAGLRETGELPLGQAVFEPGAFACLPCQRCWAPRPGTDLHGDVSPAGGDDLAERLRAAGGEDR